MRANFQLLWRASAFGQGPILLFRQRKCCFMKFFMSFFIHIKGDPKKETFSTTNKGTTVFVWVTLYMNINTYIIHKDIKIVLLKMLKKYRLISFVILLAFLYQEYPIQPEISSAPSFRIQGGTLSVTEQQRKSSRTALFLSNRGYCPVIWWVMFW